MRKADVFLKETLAGELIEIEKQKEYWFIYRTGYSGHPVSLTMPVEQQKYVYNTFPPFFDGLLPEGFQFEALLKIKKIDRNDFFTQLMAVGSDTVGAVSVKEVL